MRLEIAGTLGEAAPFGDHAAAIAGSGAGGFDGAGVDGAGFGGLTGAVERLPVIIETLGVVFAAVGIEGKLALGVGDAIEGEINGAELAVYFAGAVLLVLLEDGLEMSQGVLGPALFAGDATELEMGVGFGGVDGYGGLETANRLGVLAALLVDEAELILRVAIMGIEGGGFEHAAVALAGA